MRSRLQQTAWKALCVGGGTAGGLAIVSSHDRCNSRYCEVLRLLSPWPFLVPFSQILQQSVTSTEGPSFSSKGRSTMGQRTNQAPLHTYDFVVIGNGTAGRSAVKTLYAECPTASICVIDPQSHCTTFRSRKKQKDGAATKSQRICHYSQSAIGLYPDTRTVHITRDSRNHTRGDAFDDTNSSLQSEHDTIEYRSAVLVCTGSHGAPPPAYLMDSSAWSRIYEMRSTGTITTTADELALQQRTPSCIRARVVQGGMTKREQFSLLSPSEQLASRTVCVLGSGWEALDLVASIVTQPSDVTTANHTLTDTSRRAVLVVGCHGPLAHVLPNYLSTAVSKRLKTNTRNRVEILDRSLVRYVASDSNQHPRDTSDSAKTHEEEASSLRVYTAKSFDSLDGQTTEADCLVIAPAVAGPRGNAAVATDDIPYFLDVDRMEHHSNDGENPILSRSWYKTWSDLSSLAPDDPTTLPSDNKENPASVQTASANSALSCYKDDGRIAVTTELQAAFGVFAAGSVAKCPNSVTGHASVAGLGMHDATTAGRLAARNMARWHALVSSKASLFGRGGSSNTMERIDPIPVWRSDCLHHVDNDTNGNVPRSSLENIGVSALCVGHCDSETLSTHGVWWTNQAAQRRLMSMLSDDDDCDYDVDDEHLKSVKRKMRKRRRRMKASFKSVYGIGVVYYLDRTGKIQGIMTWGLPFAASGHDDLNESLVQQMKRVIQTNGGFRALDTELDHVRMSRFMADASKKMVVTACFNDQNHKQTTSSSNCALHADVAFLPRPLHRYTEIKPLTTRTAGVLKRKDGRGQGILGEDMFARNENDFMPDLPLPKPHPTANIGAAVAKVQALYKWNVWVQKERRWDENESRARPAKEDLLWIRKGDEERQTLQKDKVAAAYTNAMNMKRDQNRRS